MIGRVITVTPNEREGQRFDDITAETSSGFRVTAEAFYATGQDAQALPNDLVLLVEGTASGRLEVAAFIDPKSEQLASAGENRLYSRDADGNTAAALHLKNTGEIDLSSNTGGAFSVGGDGSITINGTVFKSGGIVEADTVEAAASLKAAGKELNGHLHNVTTEFAPTGPNL